MNTIKKIETKIILHANKENVWKVITEDQYTRQWWAEFSPGSHAEGDWTEGSKILFVNEEKSGMVAKITSLKPNEYLEFEYIGWIDKGVEDYDGPIAQALKGGKETYRITEQDGVTILDATSDMSEEMYDSMKALWDKAAIKLKELAENI